MRMIFENLLALLDRGEDAVLVTVVLAQGSTPRGAGSQLLAGREGLIAGTIGGGPGEAQALAFAAELLREGRSAVRRLELRHGGELDSVCGGEQTVLFQRIPRDSGSWRGLAREVLKRLEAHRSGWLALEAGEDYLVVVAHGGTQMAALERFVLPRGDYFSWQSPCGCGFALDAALWRRDRKLSLLERVCYTEDGEPWQ